jgi:glycosyltransferase involved in cell wall biosynthesis
MPVRAVLRMLARSVLANVPDEMREDLRLALIHSRAVARRALYSPKPRSSSATASDPDLVRTNSTASDDAETASDDAEKERAAMFSRAVEIGWPAKGETLWTCGLYNGMVPLRTIAEARKRFGFSCLAICYDLIRNDFPEFNPKNMPVLIWDCIATDLLDATDRILCISEYTKARLLAFANRSGRRDPDARIIQLGCDVPTPADEVALPAELEGRRYALAVGSVEQRKNLGVLTRAWEKLQDHRDFTLDLVLVGRYASWDREAGDALRESPLFGRRIIWFDECPDSMLHTLYRRADALLYPSIVEGFGLPVLEAIAHGTRVIASNAGAIPEAACGCAMLLDPGDESGWRDAIFDLALSPPARAKPMSLPTWGMATVSVVEHLLDMRRDRSA